MTKVLVVGCARSGTTWVANVLSACKDVDCINEPDETQDAKRAKMFLGHHPVIPPHTSETVGGISVKNYGELWDEAFSYDAENVIVKTVAAPYCVEWIVQRCDVDKVLWVDRNPLNTLSSWLMYERHKTDQVLEPKDGRLRRLAWLFASQYNSYRRLLMSLDASQIEVVNYEAMIELTKLRDFKVWHYITGRLGLKSDVQLETAILDLMHYGDELKSNPGLEGYTYYDHIHRDETQLDAEIWRSRITNDDADVLRDELGKWGIHA